MAFVELMKSGNDPPSRIPNLEFSNENRKSIKLSGLIRTGLS